MSWQASHHKRLWQRKENFFWARSLPHWLAHPANLQTEPFCPVPGGWVALGALTASPGVVKMVGPALGPSRVGLCSRPEAVEAEVVLGLRGPAVLRRGEMMPRIQFLSLVIRA